MKLHDLKINTEHYQAIILGQKTYEIRKNDRGYEVGDILWLRECSNGTYTGSSGLYKVKHLLETFDGLADGYVAMSLNEIIERPIA